VCIYVTVDKGVLCMNIIRKNYSKDYFGDSLKIKFDSDRNNKRLREVITRKSGGRLIEIGCGRGSFVKLAGRYFDVEGLDVSEYAVDCARNYTGRKIRLSDIQKDPLDKKSYDVVAAFNVLEHLDETEKVVEKIHGSLKNKGFLIGSVPNNYGIIGGINTKLTNYFDRTHKFTPSPKSWFKILKKAGFKKIKFFGEITFTKNNAMYLKSNLWKYLSFNLIFICSKI